MEKIDFSPFQGQMNHMVLQLAILLGVPLFTGLLIKFLLSKTKLPNNISGSIAAVVFLFVFYKMIFIVLG
jgi:hypothetical protein